MRQSFLFRSHSRLKKPFDFKRVFRFGQKTVTRYFVIYALTADQPRLGVVVSKKCSKRAVVRNRLKRGVREVFRLQCPQFQGDIVVVARPSAVRALNSELMACLKKVFSGLIKG